MRTQIKLIFFALCFLLLGSCTSPGVYIEDSNYSVKQHRVAITLALGRVREVSRNGRTIISDYHDDNFEKVEITPKTNERMFTKVSVLGSIRPYRVLVEVLIEKRDPETRQFLPFATDDKLSLRRARTVQQMLNQSRSELSTFDEENPF